MWSLQHPRGLRAGNTTSKAAPFIRKYGMHDGIEKPMIHKHTLIDTNIS